MVGPAKPTSSVATARVQAGKAISSWRETRPAVMSHSGIQNHRTSDPTRSGAGTR